MQLILQPCGDKDSQRNLKRTIHVSVPAEDIIGYLTPGERQHFLTTFPDGVAVWGVTPGGRSVNAGKWRRVELGDAVLFYRDRQFFLRGTVGYKIHSPELARKLWGVKEDGSTWEYVYCLTDLEPVEIHLDRFIAATDYASNYVVQSFSVLYPDASERVIDSLDLDIGLGASAPSDAESESAQTALDSLDGDLDISASTRRRREQLLLRKILLGRKRAECCSICSRELPVDLLVIGHIRKRHSCSSSMKKDLANVMPVCLLGCDKLFENGYIHVDHNGTIQAAMHAKPASELAEVIHALVGNQCGAWSPSSEPYFAWHRTHPRKFV